MKKTVSSILLFILLGTLLVVFGGVGRKAASVSALYGVTAAISLAAAISYWFLIRKKESWALLLFSSIFVVNTGYFALSSSRTLDVALWANRLAYLGSVFLPLSMLMIILKTCKLKYHNRLPGILVSIGSVVFLIAASPGILDIYYKDVSLSVINGSTVLEKTYGSWHCCYLFYLLAYFLATASVLLHACINKHTDSAFHALFLSAAVFINMGIWLLEQLVRIDFELLSVSYIISEMFLLLLFLMQQKNSETRSTQETTNGVPAFSPESASEEKDEAAHSAQPAVKDLEEQCAYFAAHRASLTPTERVIYHSYLAGKTTREIMAELNIKENTLKYHNKNIYSKLGVSSRKELITIASMLKTDA